MVVVVVVMVVGSGWLSSIDNKVTFPWEAAWGSRGRPPSRAAGPPLPRQETTEGHQPAGGEEEQEQHRLNWEEEEQEEEDVSRSAEHGRAKGVKRWTGWKGGEHTSVHTYCNTGSFV